MTNATGRRDQSVGRRVSIAAAWMVAFRWVDRLIGLASIAVLARLLSPADFGIVGYAMLVLGLLELFAGLATDIELIRSKDADRSYYDAAWTMNILRGFAIGALIAALTLPAVAYFKEPALAPIMLAFIAIPVMGGFGNVGIVEFRKHLQFDREFRFLLVVRLVRTAVTIALAFALRSYWALVAGAIVGVAFQVAWSYKVHPLRPRFALARVPEMFRFSRWMMLQNLVLGFYEKLPGFLIGREWSSSDLAFFNTGKEISNLAASELQAPIRRALYPGLAQLSDRHQHLSDMLVGTTGMLALLTIPIPLGIALVAGDLVPLFLGPRWVATVDILQPLCIAAAISGAGTNSRLVFLALGRSHLPAIAGVVRLLLLAALLTVVVPYGVVGIAYALAAVSCALTLADYALTSRLLGIGAGRFVAVVWRPVLAAIVMSVAVIALRRGFAPATDLPAHAWSLVRCALAGAAVYVVCVLALWYAAGRRDGAERRVLSLIGR